MRIPGLSTISGRIVLGFAVLILTFGAVSITTVVNMERLGTEIGIIRTGYVPLVFTAKELRDAQNTLVLYLDDLPGEATALRARNKLRLHRSRRDRLLRELEEAVAALQALRRGRSIAGAANSLRDIRQSVDAQSEHYDKVLESPPLDRPEPTAPSPDRRAQQLAATGLARLRTNEPVVLRTLDTVEFGVKQFEGRAKQLENYSAELRLWTIYLGATAVLAGLLMTAWATLTLRPLSRLRDGARRIARGDYASRVASSGPAEVAELGREFNAMAQAIEERERELVRTERLAVAGKMAAMITHEVRNPLSSIGLNTELLEEELAALPPERATEARGLCRAITHEVDRLTGITEEYLHFARLPKPRLQPEPINAVVQSLVDFERESLALRDITVTLELAADLPQAAVDDGQLRQALLNLIRNGADAVADLGGGSVTVRTRRGVDAGGHATVEVEVADDGPGIAPDLLPKLFDPFFSTKEGGTGLGLALTHQIIREHGGSIRVASTPGEGARFVVVVPALTGDGADHTLPAS